MNQDIFERQRLIGGWEQERLTRACVAVVGSDWLAGYCALYLACLGVGRIYLLDSARARQEERFFFTLAAGEPRVKGWANWLTGLGFSNRLIARHASLVYNDQALLPPADVIICATDCAELREALAQQSTLLVTAQSADGAEQSAIIGALLVEEARRHLLPLPSEPAARCAPHLPERFAAYSPRPLSQPRNIMLIGAGALGTFVALGLAARAESCSLTIVDPDYIEASNLNRQPLYLRNVGDGKAITLANWLREIQPAMQVNYVAEPVSPQHFDQFSPDLVLSCVDSFAPRQLLHRECVRRAIPLINGGTSAFSGHLEVYQPDRSACFNCLYALDDLAEREMREPADPARCGRVAEASVVTTNALIGALMASEVCRLNDPPRQMIDYFGRDPLRWRLGYPRRACYCKFDDRVQNLN